MYFFQNKKRVLQVGIVATFLLLVGVTAHAQSLTDFTISITPGEPRAQENILAKIESASLNLNTARVSWVLDGRAVAEGVGITQFSFKTGSLGSVSRIRVSLSTVAGQRIERSFSVRPAEVDLIWEASTYTPLLYKGKALASSKSKVKISAIPHFVLENGRKISSGNLIYTWQKDRRVLGSLSGTGKESIVIDAPRLFEETRISVSVSSLDDSRHARSEIILVARDPEIIFYEKHPTEGIRYENANSGEIDLAQEEITVRAEPYFFSLEDLASRNISFSWSLNNNKVEPTEVVNEVTLRRETGGISGVARLSLQMENAAKILQQATAELIIRF